jgi:hypothetical protein
MEHDKSIIKSFPGTKDSFWFIIEGFIGAVRTKNVQVDIITAKVRRAWHDYVDCQIKDLSLPSIRTGYESALLRRIGSL